MQTSKANFCSRLLQIHVAARQTRIGPEESERSQTTTRHTSVLSCWPMQSAHNTFGPGGSSEESRETATILVGKSTMF